MGQILRWLSVLEPQSIAQSNADCVCKPPEKIGVSHQVKFLAYTRPQNMALAGARFGIENQKATLEIGSKLNKF